MKELYPVRLNGVGLNAIDTRFHVANVEEEAPKIKVTTQSRAKYDGLRMMRRERETRRIIVHVVLWERDKMKRLALYDKLVEWAENGGRLTLGYRNGQQIRVECTELPDISGRDWKEEVDVVFTAYDPYWRVWTLWQRAFQLPQDRRQPRIYVRAARPGIRFWNLKLPIPARRP